MVTRPRSHWKILWQSSATMVATRILPRRGVSLQARVPGPPGALRMILWILPFALASTSFLSAGQLGDSVFLARLLIAGLVTVGITLSISEAGSRKERPRMRPEQSAVLVFVAGLIVWGSASFFWLRDPILGARSVVNLIFALGLAWGVFVIVRRFPSLLFDLSWGWLAAVWVTTAIGLIEVLAGVRLPIERTEYLEDALSTKGFWTGSVFQNPNDMGAFMLVALPSVLFLLRFSHGSRRLIPLLTLPVALVGTLLPAARIASGGLVLTLLVYLVIRDDAGVISRILTVLASLLVIVGLVSLFPYYLSKLEFLGSSISPDYENSRTQLAVDGLALLARTGGAGVGAGNFEEYGVEPGLPYERLVVFNPHNLFIEVLSEYGVLLGASLILGLGWMGWRWVRGVEVSAATRPILLAGLVGFVFAGMESSKSLTLNTLAMPIMLTLIASFQQDPPGPRHDRPERSGARMLPATTKGQ